jgi:hypothetical protein
MDTAPESFPYRCLPLAIANSHGWEILSPCGFEACWNGGPATEDVTVVPDLGTESQDAPVALFGQGTITFHVAGLFRTSPGWNLWVGGPPNAAKDGLAPLGGIVETDWSPFTFTMNWRFTRPNQWIRFEENEPFCFIFPIERNMIETVQPRFVPIDDAPDVKAQFEAWSRSRDAFQREVERNPPASPTDKWQKLYYRGVDAYGHAAIDDHKSKLRLRDFKGDVARSVPQPRCPARPAARPTASAVPHDPGLALRKRDWLLQTQERMRALSPTAGGIFRKVGIGSQEFLDEHYAAGKPVIVGGEIDDWPATRLWTPDYLRQKVGGRIVEVQLGRKGNPDFEREKDRHRHRMSFDAFIDVITESADENDCYLTAYNSTTNAETLSVLDDDLGFLDTFLTRDAAFQRGMMWIGPAGTFTPLHHDLTNNLLVQITGRKRVVLAAPGEIGRLYNDRHVFSMIRDVAASDLELTRYPLLAGIRLHELILEPGDALFIPVGWWHQVTALDFSVSITHTNFKWPNDVYEGYPVEG